MLKRRDVLRASDSGDVIPGGMLTSEAGDGFSMDDSRNPLWDVG